MATTAQLVEWVDKILKSGVNLNTREQEFIESMEEKVERYGDRTFFSEKQAEWIEDIYAKRVP